MVRSKTGWVRCALLAAALQQLASCSPKPMTTSERWRVVSFVSAPISALSDAEAATWIGRALELRPDLASFGDERYEHPTYLRSEQTRTTFRSSAKLDPAELGLFGAEVSTLQVSPTPGPGHLLYLVSAERALTLWDGVYFVLERQP